MLKFEDKKNTVVLYNNMLFRRIKNIGIIFLDMKQSILYEGDLILSGPDVRSDLRPHID